MRLFLLISLLSFPFSAALNAQDMPVGWASANGGTTGGVGGEEVTVTSRSELALALLGNEARIIRVVDTIDLVLYERIKMYGNKTLIGDSPKAMIRYGGLEVVGNNVIIQNLSIGDSYDGDFDGKTHSTDAITVYGQNVWIDHCWFYSAADGLVDIRSGNGMDADFITISNCRFSDHNKVSLIGSSDDQVESRGHLKTTYYNCWFDGTYGKGLTQRLPRVRFGDVHILNSYYEDILSYAAAARFESNVVIENTYFRNTKNPHVIEDEGKGIREPELVAINNLYEGSTGSRETGGDAFIPADFYAYTALPTEEVPAAVMNAAGPFNPDNNEPPVAVTDTVDMTETVAPTVIDATANDTDADGGELRIARILNEPSGLVTLRDNLITFIPPSAATGSETIEYELVDTQGGVTEGKVLVVYDKSTVATRNVLPEGALTLSPNPASGEVRISVGRSAPPNASLHLIDAYGRQLPARLFTASGLSDYRLNTANLAAGIYHVVIRSGSAIGSKRLIVSR
ncbi:Ig-like domain-containing protein [Lewinella sp. IMCC34191]|uniref:pectate lyase family protein n=1 Tax=Lewinella sp. IMCC34191 TaxID=2259172 RepID=UPI0018E53440|nr:Ig-like domain-containing protein [Lewinella sp. IMCC34191]